MDGAEVVQEAAGTKSTITYTGRQQAIVAQWVALRPIFEVCAGETGYEGVYHRREAWCLQREDDKKLWATPIEILWEARIRRQWEGRATQ